MLPGCFSCFLRRLLPFRHLELYIDPERIDDHSFCLVDEDLRDLRRRDHRCPHLLPTGKLLEFKHIRKQWLVYSSVLLFQDRKLSVLPDCNDKSPFSVVRQQLLLQFLSTLLSAAAAPACASPA